MNSDFYALYRCRRAQRDDNASARILTGYELSTDSLCRLTRSLKASEHKVRAVESQLAHANSCLRAKEAELRTLQARETDARQDESSRMNAGRLILAFKHIGDLSEATALKLLQALRFRAVPVNELIMTRFGNKRPRTSRGACSGYTDSSRGCAYPTASSTRPRAAQSERPGLRHRRRSCCERI